MKQESLFPDDSVQGVPVTAGARKKAPAKERPAPKRRAKAKRQVEDYYALLGVTPDDTADIIKQRYLENVRKYPPEKFPDEFKALRAAYDTLRDPALRQQYDILFKYGETVEDLVREAMQKKRHKTGVTEAKKLLQRAIAIDPQHKQARLHLARAHLYLGSMVEFELECRALKKIASPSEWPDLWEQKMYMLCEEGRADIAYNELQENIELNPYSLGQQWELYLDVYDAVGCKEEIIEEFVNRIRAVKEPVPNDLYYYIGWISVASAGSLDRELNKAQAAVQKFLRNFRYQPGSQQMIEMLLAECRKWRDEEGFDEAKIFADLAHSLDKNNRTLQEMCRELRPSAN